MGNHYTPFGRKGSSTGEPCPFCGLRTAEYTGARRMESGANLDGFEYTCTACGVTGTEWYRSNTTERKVK